VFKLALSTNMVVDFNTAESQHIIVERCRHICPKDKSVISRDNTVNLVVRLTSTIAVKFGIGVTAAEACALRYASCTLDPAIVKVPEFIQFFTTKDDLLWTTGYLVMSFMEGTILDEVISADCGRFLWPIIKAMDHLHSFTSLRPGPLDSGYARGLLWSEVTSGQSFASCDDLQRYLDVRLAFLGNTATINVRDVQMSFCHLDIAPRNILVGNDGSIGLLDWGCAGFYPKVFDIWAVTFEAHIRGHSLIESLATGLAGRWNSRECAEIHSLSMIYSINQLTTL